MNDIDRLVAEIAPDPGPGMTPLAGDLFEEITASAPADAAGPRPRRRWLAVPVAAALAVALTWASPGGIGPAPASAALDIKRDGDFYVITVKDLFADPEMYQSELRARGLDITLRVVPTSASGARSILVLSDVDRLRAGKAVPADGPITTIDAPGPCERFATCAIGLKVPVDYDKKAEIVLGRQARPGEKYKMPPGIAMPGEPLHCVAYVNKPVAEIVSILRERGVRTEFVSSAKGHQTSVPGDWYVLDGVMSADGEALLLTGPAPDPDPGEPDDACRTG